MNGASTAVWPRLTIRIMDGVEVVMVDCGLKPDGALRSTGK